MRYETSTTSAAEPARLWAVVSDVERWPEWIEVYEEVRRDGHGEIALADTAYVKQKGLAGGTWTVSELDEGPDEGPDEGSVFAWESRQPGVRMVGRHVVTREDGGSRLTLQFDMTGWLSGLVGALLGRRIRSYVDLEAARLATVAAERTTT